MNPEQLLVHFDRVVDTPDAIARLRKLILDLAVRGKLTTQNSNEESAAEVINQIVASGALRELTQRKRKSTSTVSEEEPFVTPTNWSWTSLGSVTRIRTGKLDANAAVKGGRYPFFTCSQTPSEIDSYSFDTAAVLLAGNGDFNLKVYSGKFDAYQRTYVIEPTGWDVEFCFILIQSQISRITDNQRGSAIPYLKLGDIADLLVPLPPLAEQRRIVATVDELMALCDRLEAARKARESTCDRLAAASLVRLNAPHPETFHADAHFVLDALPAVTSRADQIKQLRQSVLNLAVRGYLVPQVLKDEPAANFDREIPADLTRPFEIPSTWKWSRFCMLGKLRGGGTPSKSRDDFWNGPIPWVSPKDMKIDYIASAQMSVTDDAIENSAANVIKMGSVLFVVRGMILAHSFPVAVSHAPLAINQDMKALELFDPEMAEFVLRALKGLKPEILQRVQRSSHGTCRLEATDYSDFLMPVPPLAEQHRIVAKVDELMALCDRLEANLTLADEARLRLLDALLHEALEPTNFQRQAA